MNHSDSKSLMSAQRCLTLAAWLLAAATLIAGQQRLSSPAPRPEYFPDRWSWEQRKPEEVGMSSARLQEVVEFAAQNEAKTHRDGAELAQMLAGEPYNEVVGPTMSRGPNSGLVLRHGYIVLVLFRQGVGLSIGQDSSDGDRMAQARLSGGQHARNETQLELLDGSELAQAQAGVQYLRERTDVDRQRIGLLGHSLGGSLSLLLAARDTSIRVVVSFGGAAGSWEDSPDLRARLVVAVGQTRAAVFFNHAANDYSTASGTALAAEMKRLGRPHLLRIYPAVGQSSRDGHNMVYRDPSVWKSDVVAFLSQHLARR